MTELSLDKPETDEEEEDHWRDASPLTPICSPTKHPPRPLQTDTPSKTAEVEVVEFHPAGSGGVREDVVLAISGAVPLDAKVAASHSQGATTGVEKVAPKVKLKRERSIGSEDEPMEKVPEETTSTQKRPDQETKRTLRRADSEDRMSSSREMTREVADKGAKKKILKMKDIEERGRKDNAEDEYEESWKRGDVQDGEKMTRERRKSLREQECIERVTEFLTKHSGLSYAQMPPSIDRDEDVEPMQYPQEVKEQRATRPSSLIAPESISRPVEQSSTEETRDATGSTKATPEESTRTPSTVGSEKPVTVDQRSGRVDVPKTTILSPETEVSATKRRSSMRKRTFSRESSRESLLDDTKKEVRIQENVEEIFFEDISEQISGMPEVQLVKARIITAEEAAANRAEEPARVEVHSPPEVLVVSDSIRVRTGRVPSPEMVNMSRLQLLSLAKSTSENTLVDTKDGEENSVSQRNLKSEILLDLSRVPDGGEEEAVNAVDKQRKERKLSRTGSEGSRMAALRVKSRMKDQDIFKIGSLAQPDEPELTILLENVGIEGKRIGDQRRRSLIEDCGWRVAER